MRGPAGKPTSLQILHGDRKDRISDAEPVPGRGDRAAGVGVGDGPDDLGSTRAEHDHP